MANGSTLSTNDGRVLAYAEAGERDGVPIFYFHGTPGSRYDLGRRLNRPALDGVAVRIIGIDRPGFGGSTFQADRRFTDWPTDVAAVADHLGLDRFGVLAYSAGGLYAAACALAYPERLTFVGIVSGNAPAETPGFRDGMCALDANMTRIARGAPMVGRLAIKLAAKMAAASPERFSATFDRELSEPDRELHRDPRMRQMLRDMLREATRGGPRGVVEDYRLWARPSGLELAAVQSPIRLWHGDADAIVPLHHAEHLAACIPNATLTVLPGVGHLHTAERWREILQVAVAG